MENELDPRQGRVPVLSVSHRVECRQERPLTVGVPGSYWVIAVVPYLLWAFCTNHTREECEKIFRVRPFRCRPQ